MPVIVTVPTGTCILCEKPSELNVEPEVAGRIKAWQNTSTVQRALVQVAFPDLSPGQREQLATHTHERCFDVAFPEDA